MNSCWRCCRQGWAITDPLPVSKAANRLHQQPICQDPTHNTAGTCKLILTGTQEARGRPLTASWSVSLAIR
jgi:hypothetical protein